MIWSIIVGIGIILGIIASTITIFVFFNKQAAIKKKKVLKIVTFVLTMLCLLVVLYPILLFIAKSDIGIIGRGIAVFLLTLFIICLVWWLAMAMEWFDKWLDKNIK